MAVTAAALLTREASPEMMTGQPKFEFDPQATGGFLLDGGAGSSVQVDIESLGEEAYRGGTTQLDAYRITTVRADESKTAHSYNVRTNTPNHLRSDTLVESTTPWTTREGGFNKRFMSGLNDLGYATMFVEPRGGAIRASLIDSADNLNYIGQIARDYRLSSGDIRPDNTLYVGASRAAAIGSGVISTYSDLIAPCYVIPGTRQELPKAALQLGLEMAEAGKHLASLGLREVVSQRGTFSAHPVDLIHTVLAIPHLRNRDAGKLFWSNSAEASHITLFDKDGWSQPDEVAKMADDKPNMHVEVLGGRHMALAKPEVIQASLDRFDTLAEMRGFDGEVEDADFDEIWKIQPPAQKSALGNLSLRTVIKAGYNLASTS